MILIKSCVYLNVSTIRVHEIFINIRPCSSDESLRRVGTAFGSDLSEQFLMATTSFVRVIYVNVVILRVHRLLDERLAKRLSCLIYVVTFWIIFGTFWTIFGTHWTIFWNILDNFWNILTIFGTFWTIFGN